MRVGRGVVAMIGECFVGIELTEEVVRWLLRPREERRRSPFGLSSLKGSLGKEGPGAVAEVEEDAS